MLFSVFLLKGLGNLWHSRLWENRVEY